VADTPLQVTGRQTKQKKPSPWLHYWGMRRNERWPPFKITRCSPGTQWPISSQVLTTFKILWNRWIFIGAGSLPIILLSGFFIGAVMVLQTGSQFIRFGQTSLTGDVVAIALVRELGRHLQVCW